MTVLAIIVAILCLSFIIIFHELGHFSVAKSFGIRVQEFGIGYPPKMWGVQRGETTYSINWLPFGGFNKFYVDETGEDKHNLDNQPYWKKILVFLAGSFATFIVTFLFIFLSLIIPHDAVAGGNISVAEVAANSPAYISGLETGDLILEANGIKLSYEVGLAEAIKDKLDQENILVVQKKDGSVVTITIIPRSNPPEGQGAIGITAQIVNYDIVPVSTPFFKAIPESIIQTFSLYGAFFAAIGSLFTGGAKLDLTGPVGIVQLTGEIAQYGMASVMQLMAILCINLTVLNLLPVPGLDGGHILIAIIEWIRGKRLSDDTRSRITMIGFILMIILIVIASYSDISRLITGEKLLP